MEAITTALGTAITSVSTTITGAVGDNLGAILGIGAIFIVINAVWRLVKRVAK